MKEHQPYTGTGVAMVTPFNKEGEVDFDALVRLTDKLINNGISYLVVLGTTAETPTLSSGEKQDIVRCVVDAGGGRVPVVVGAGGNDTRAVIQGLKEMNREGVDAVLSVVPYYSKPSQEGIYQHFSAVAASTDIPMMLYNVPGRTGINMSADIVTRLATDYPNTVVALKEASGNFEQISDILRDKPSGFQVVSGDDSITLPMISLGASGVVSVIGNGYPAIFSTMVAAALEGAWDKARELHFRLTPMMKAIFKEGNPAGIKAAMEAQGWIKNVLRLPLISASRSLQQEILELDKLLH